MEALASTENTAPTRKQKRAFASPSQNKRSKYSTEEVEFRHCGLEGLRRPLLSANADTTTQMNENYRPSHALSSEGIGISSNPHTLIASLRRRTSLQRYKYSRSCWYICCTLGEVLTLIQFLETLLLQKILYVPRRFDQDEQVSCLPMQEVRRRRT